MSRLRHSELTYPIKGAIYQVRNELGIGWSEEVYHQALYALLQSQNIHVLSKPRKTLRHHDISVHTFEPDLIIQDKIVLELKSLPYQKQFIGEHYAQLIHYLKFYGKDLGLLVNFAPLRVRVKRVLWDEPPFEISESYEEFDEHLLDRDRQHLLNIRKHLLTIGREFGFGYPETVYRRLVAIEIEQNGVNCQEEAVVSVDWRNDTSIGHKTPCLLIDNSYLLHIRALLPRPTDYDFRRVRTYLKSLGLRFGLVANFGKTQLQIHGVRAQ